MFGNPHSQNPSSSLSSDRIDEVCGPPSTHAAQCANVIAHLHHTAEVLSKTINLKCVSTRLQGCDKDCKLPKKKQALMYNHNCNHCVGSSLLQAPCTCKLLVYIRMHKCMCVRKQAFLIPAQPSAE